MAQRLLYKLRALSKCSVDGCGNVQHTRGYCQKHYLAFLKDGTIPTILKQVRNLSVEERFFSYVKKTESCWLWTGATNEKGYGMFYIQKDRKVTRYKSHRFSYEHHKGDIPEGMFVCHHCDVKGCVNPEHLFVGTNLENVQDMIAKNLAPERRKQLRRQDVVDAAKMLGLGYKTSQIAREIGLKPTVVYQIKRLKTPT